LLEGNGVDDSTKIWFIDINVEEERSITINTGEERGIEITNYPDL
jgi:hypothetical protein